MNYRRIISRLLLGSLIVGQVLTMQTMHGMHNDHYIDQDATYNFWSNAASGLYQNISNRIKSWNEENKPLTAVSNIYNNITSKIGSWYQEKKPIKTVIETISHVPYEKETAALVKNVINTVKNSANAAYESTKNTIATKYKEVKKATIKEGKNVVRDILGLEQNDSDDANIFDEVTHKAMRNVFLYATATAAALFVLYKTYIYCMDAYKSDNKPVNLKKSFTHEIIADKPRSVRRTVSLSPKKVPAQSSRMTRSRKIPARTQRRIVTQAIKNSRNAYTSRKGYYAKKRR